MKRRISIFAVLTLFVSIFFVQAQERKRPTAEELTKRTVEQLKQRLSLTKDQEPKVAEIVTKYTASFDPNADRESQMKERRDNNAKMTQAIDSVLTKEQKGKYAKMQEEMKNRRRGDGNSDRPSRDGRSARN